MMVQRIYYAFLMASCTLIAALNSYVFAAFTYGILLFAFLEWYAMNLYALDKSVWFPHKAGYIALAIMQQAILNLDFLHVTGLFSIVWLTDIGALSFGKLFGGPKLFPSVSPNKTVIGFALGICCGVLANNLHAHIAHEFFQASEAYDQRKALTIAILAQLSDLLESACKRQVGIKDSNLPELAIPGHGGILDRIDALLLSAPFAYLASRQ